MKSQTRFINGLIISFFILLGGGIGFLIGSSLIGEYNPQWDHYSIEAPPKDIVNIVHIEIESSLYDPTGDIVYVTDKSGVVYSNTTFQSDWTTIDPVPSWDNDYLSECATEKDNPSDSHMWDTPPVEKGVLDSAGVRFERPVSTIVRCYVLLDDGSLDVWVHSGDAMGLMAGEIIKVFLIVLGAIIGIIVGTIIIRFRKRKESVVI